MVYLGGDDGKFIDDIDVVFVFFYYCCWGIGRKVFSFYKSRNFFCYLLDSYIELIYFFVGICRLFIFIKFVFSYTSIFCCSFLFVFYIKML